MGDWQWGSLLALNFQFTVLILRSVEFEQISRENQPFHVHLQMNQMWGEGVSLLDFFMPREIFPSGNPTKIKNTHVWANESLPNAARTLTLSKAEVFVPGPCLAGRTHFRVPWGSHWLLRDWMGSFLAVNDSWHPTPPLQIWLSEQLS